MCRSVCIHANLCVRVYVPFLARYCGNVGDPSSAIPSVKEILRAAIEAEKRPFRVFGDGHNQRLRDMWGIENLLSLPLLEEVSRCGDKGRPYVLAHPASEVASVMRELATGVVKELMRLAKEGSASPTLEFEPWGAEQAPQATSSGELKEEMKENAAACYVLCLHLS